jgi:hypothetical protein
MLALIELQIIGVGALGDNADKELGFWLHAGAVREFGQAAGSNLGAVGVEMR